MKWPTSKSVTLRLLSGLVLAFLMLSSTGCATSKPAPDIQVRERVVTVPRLFLQPVQVEPLQGQTNEDLERQRNAALAAVKEGNDRLAKIGKWSDGEASRSEKSAPVPSGPPASTKPTSYQLLKASLKQYSTKKGDEQ